VYFNASEMLLLAGAFKLQRVRFLGCAGDLRVVGTCSNGLRILLLAGESDGLKGMT
jgi:hypothetical protein